MSSTKLSGLAADAGSGSEDDEAPSRASPSPSSSSARSIAVAIEKTDDGLSAVRFAAENVLKDDVRTMQRERAVS